MRQGLTQAQRGFSGFHNHTNKCFIEAIFSAVLFILLRVTEPVPSSPWQGQQKHTVWATIVFYVFYVQADVIQQLREQKWPEPTSRQHMQLIKGVAKFWHLVTTEYDSNSSYRSYYFSPSSLDYKNKKKEEHFLSHFCPISKIFQRKRMEFRKEWILN